MKPANIHAAAAIIDGYLNVGSIEEYNCGFIHENLVPETTDKLLPICPKNISNARLGCPHGNSFGQLRVVIQQFMEDGLLSKREKQEYIRQVREIKGRSDNQDARLTQIAQNGNNVERKQKIIREHMAQEVPALWKICEDLQRMYRQRYDGVIGHEKSPEK